jgi:hypothetical protein
MQSITTIGLEIAKSVFQVHGIDVVGQVVMRRQLKRRYVLKFFEKLPPCLVGVEVCASSHHWSRELQALGHTPANAPRCVGRRCGRTVLAMLCLSTRRDAILGVWFFVALSAFTSITLADPKCPAGKHWLRGACRPIPTSSTQAIQCISDCKRLFRNHPDVKARARYIRQCQHDCTHL